MVDDTQVGGRIGPIRLAPGATARQVGIFLVVITITAVMFGFVGIIQPYLFSEVMHVPTHEQGRLTGFLQMLQYIAVFIFIIPAGNLADRLGRKFMLIMGMCGFIISLIVMPFCAPIWAMAIARFFFGVVSTGHTSGGATMMVDFPSNPSRGKFIALMLVVQSLAGALFSGYLLTRTPGWLIGMGFERPAALRVAMWGLAGVGVIGVMIAIFLFRAPPHGTQGKKGLSFVQSSKAILALSKADPTFGLVVLIAFVIRSDIFVTASFLAIWVMTAAKLGGADPADALKTVGTLQVILSVSLALSPLALGFLADRMNRVVMLIGALVFAAIMFAATALIKDVQGVGIMALVALIGFAESAQSVSSQALFGERAPPELRGSAMSFFVLMGTISVIVVSYISGQLFDKIGFTAPFTFLAILNIVFAVAATILVLRTKAKEKREAAAGAR